jgi:uncharacterized protein (TIGR02246 family)
MLRSKLFIPAALAFLPALFAQSKPTSLEARIQRLDDIEQIRTVLIDYGRFLDARDFVSYSRLFAKDGEWVGGFGTVKGPAAIQAFMEKNVPGPNSGHNYHLLSNFEIEVLGDTATAWSRWTFVVPGPDQKPVMAQGGRYDDVLVREQGHWKFKRRVASNDLPSSGPVQTK